MRRLERSENHSFTSAAYSRLGVHVGIGHRDLLFLQMADLTQRFLFRPLTRRIGAPSALLIGFFVSGLIHDAIISIPARGGYGEPTLFFLIQAMGLFIERSQPARRLGLGRGVRGWLFTMAFLLLPARLLFHRPFVVGIIVPFMPQSERSMSHLISIETLSKLIFTAGILHFSILIASAVVPFRLNCGSPCKRCSM